MFFRNIVGHSELKRHLTDMVDSGRIPHAQLYTGAEGVGKLALALAVAQYICCEHREGESHVEGVRRVHSLRNCRIPICILCFRWLRVMV